MAKRFVTCSLDQPFLLAPNLQDWLPQGHLARFIADLVGELDLSAIMDEYQRADGRGQSAYHPEMMTRLLLYAYAIGQPSSRRIEEATYTDLAYRYLSANQHPDHDTFCAFRQRHLEQLANLFVQVLQICQKAGLVKLGHVAIDGTKIKAHASRNRTVSHGRLSKKEQYWQDKVAELLAKAAAADAAESKCATGTDVLLPPDLAHAQTRLAKIRAAKQALEQEAQQKLAAAAKAYSGSTKPVGQADQEAKKAPKAADPVAYSKNKRAYSRAKKNAAEPASSYNFTDPDSRLMMDGATKATVQAYNAQAAVDDQAQIIVAAVITQQENDRNQLAPMLAAVEANTGKKPELTTADNGYWDSETIAAVQEKGFAVLVPPESKPGGELTSSSPRNAVAEAMRTRIATEEGRAQYSKRQGTVEPVFGNTKQARGYRQFALRGKTKVTAEWKIICLTHNLCKLGRHRQGRNNKNGREGSFLLRISGISTLLSASNPESSHNVELCPRVVRYLAC